jgi:16S rRNA (uracil1498-N3)-methyltransferase
MVGGSGPAMMAVLVGRDGGAVGQRGSLMEGEEHHLRVRRAEPGEEVAVRDGEGLVGTGRLVRDGREWRVEIESAERLPRPPELVLAVGAGDRDRFAWLVEKAAELGATAVVPVETARTGGVATRIRAQHVPKLRRHALEALKQCGAAWVCRLEDPVSLEGILGRPLSGQGWLGNSGGSPPAAALGATAVTVLVGPEGGLEEPEIRAAISAGYRPVALGPHTLRFETAAIAAAVAVIAARLRGDHG